MLASRENRRKMRLGENVGAGEPASSMDKAKDQPALQRRPLDFRRLDEVIADVRRLHGVGYVRLGNWSLSQICDHLAIFYRGSLEGFGKPLPWVVRVLVGKPMLASTLRRRAFRTGLKVPRRFLPGDPREDGPSVAELVALVERFRDRPGEYEPSPIFGRLSREQWTDLHLIHSSHHLSFLVPGGEGVPPEHGSG